MPRTRERNRQPPQRVQPVPTRSREWSVNIPFADLQMLLDHVGSMEKAQEENAQLRRELEGLRNMFSELQTAFGELRRELKGR